MNPNIVQTISLCILSSPPPLRICLLPHWVFLMVFSLLSKYFLGFTSKQIEHYIGKKKNRRSDMTPPARARVHRIRSEVFPAENSPSSLSWILPTFLIPCLQVILIPPRLPHSSGQSYTAPSPPLPSHSSSLHFRPLRSPLHCCVKINKTRGLWFSLSHDYDVSKMKGTTRKGNETRRQEEF